MYGNLYVKRLNRMQWKLRQNNKIPEHIIENSKEMGLFSLSIPEEYGGLGLDMVGKCAII